VPTRKQRRRRAKDFRHDMRIFEVDSEGNEVPIANLREREDGDGAKPKAKAQTQAKGRGRQAGRTREVPPPTWERALRRGGPLDWSSRSPRGNVSGRSV